MIKTGDKVTWVEHKPAIQKEPKTPDEDYIIEAGSPHVVKGVLGNLDNVYLPVLDSTEGLTLYLYKDLKNAGKGKVRYAFRLAAITRIKEGTEGLSDEEEIIPGKICSRVAKLADISSISLPVISDDGVESIKPYKDLKFMEDK